MGVQETFLSSFQVLRTQDLDQARHAVAQRYCDHRLHLVQNGPLDVRHNHARGRHVSVNLLTYGGHVAIDPGELQGFYLLQIPIAGAARVAHRGEDIDANAHAATILNPDRTTQMQWRGDCVKLMLQIDADFLHHVASQAIDADPPGQIRFAPRVDLTCDAGRALRHLVIASAQAFEAGRLGAASQGLQMMAIERELALSLLTHQPSNLSHLLNKPLCSLAPRTIRRALDFIHTHYADDICLEDIALATQAHPRTLQIGFQQAFGKSPMGYLRDVRLDMAKFFLARRTDRPKVSDVAYDCGFNHLGRFSRDFRARFGHAPSSECDS